MTDRIRNTIFTDSSAFAALAIQAEMNHCPAIEILRQLSTRRRRLCTTTFIVAETHALVLSWEG